MVILICKVIGRRMVCKSHETNEITQGGNAEERQEPGVPWEHGFVRVEWEGVWGREALPRSTPGTQ